jgi:polyvinyl alcohol dehydrogenase (cytochrome)
MWGPAVDNEHVYVALSDAVRVGRTAAFDSTQGGGLFALSLVDGGRLWTTPAPPCRDKQPCSPVQAAAVTAMPGVVFSGSVDGHMRGYSTSDGKIIWDYDSAHEYSTVNGVKAKGGSINNGGPAVVGGMLFTNSGYSHHSGVMPGNVLLAFSLD